MELSDFVVDRLRQNGVSHGFFIIGGALGFFADACARKNFTLYTTHHEQGAAFAAYAQAEVSRGYGLAMATSGPGATNLITGIGSAYFNSLPVIFITGQVNTHESNLTGKRRQVGFQETDIVPIVKPITKYAVQVTDPSRILYEFEKALFIAKHSRMGPVLLDLPLNIQKAQIDEKKLEHFIGSPEHRKMSATPLPDKKTLADVAKQLTAASRPIILVGHGVRLAGAEGALQKFVDKSQIPLVASLMGTDALPNTHPLYYGFIGTYGTRSSNFALANSDLILVVGARLDSRQIGVQAGKFAPDAKIIHIDIDSTELGASVKNEQIVHCDAKAFLEGIIPFVSAQKRPDWISHLDFLKKNYSSVLQETGDAISPTEAISALSVSAKEGDIACVDVGSHQMWFAQSWSVKKGQSVLTDGGMGPMGFSLPAAIGASISAPGKNIYVVSGDGGMQMNIQEFQTIVRHKLPVKVMVINNNSLGMLTQFQTENFQGRMIGSVDGYSAPDFAKVATAYGIPSARVEKRGELASKVAWLSSQKGPALLEVIVPRTFMVYPKSNYSRPVYDMKPLLPFDELKKALKYVDEKELAYDRK